MSTVPRESEDQLVDANGHEPLDSIRSWLASGAQVVDRRRRFGRHGTAKRLLVVDPASRPNGSERWHTTTSALQRHTIGGALSEIDPEHRRVITLAYLEGRTNREIATTLGVSVTTARRRLLAALERLETIVSAAGAWLVGVLVGFAIYVLARLARLTDSADKMQRVAATVTVGALAAAAVGVVTYMPSSSGPHHGVPAPPAALAPLGTNLIVSNVADAPGGTLTPDTPVGGGEKAPKSHDKDSTPSGQAASGGAANPGANGCHGNPTGAPPGTPIGYNGHLGPPVNPPGRGGCRSL
ncbi:MAG TPA: RNA polymerase sigma factor [Candidatus Dormibacteraeota bacterium]|nr:RNA polymerase sigma factor [Candidatus Dormibacteraeota bacterium]